VVEKEGGPGREKLPACCGGGLAEGHRGVVCALRIREATSFREGGVFVAGKGDGVDTDRCKSQLIGLNLLIFVIAWDKSWSWD